MFLKLILTILLFIIIIRLASNFIIKSLFREVGKQASAGRQERKTDFSAGNNSAKKRLTVFRKENAEDVDFVEIK